MDSSNTSITTKNGYTVEFKTFITGRQKRHIQDAFLEDVTVSGSADGSKPSFSMQGTKANVAQDRAVEAVVVKVTGPGVDENKTPLDQVFDLPSDDSDEVLAKVEEITGDKKKLENTPKT